MQSPFATKIETPFGTILILIFSAFLVSVFWLSLNNLKSDTDVLSSTNAKIKIISPEEKKLIDFWLKDSNVGLSAQEVGYRYILSKYPDKPWMDLREVRQADTPASGSGQ